MAFPTIPGVGNGRINGINQADTSSLRTFPDLSSITRNAGDLFIAIITTYAASGTDATATFSAWGGGFTEFYDNAGTTGAGGIAIGAAYKWSDGTETGTFTVFQVPVAGEASMILLSIPGAHSSSPPEAGGYNRVVNGQPDIASFNPSWGAEDTLWIAVGCAGMSSAAGSWTATGTHTITNYGDSYDTNTPDSSRAGQMETCVLFRQLNAASEDPAAFAGFDTSNSTNAGALIAVRPAAVVGPIIRRRGGAQRRTNRLVLSGGF